MSSISERLTLLRNEMHKHSISAFIVPGTDPHLSEYIPDYWQERAFISGFTGSAGKVVITHNKAALWTDSRYFLQGAEQLKDTGIELMKMRMPGTPSINQWLGQVLEKEDTVGMNPLLVSAGEFMSNQTELESMGLNLIASPDLISAIWENRPQLPIEPVILLEDDVTGESTESKLNRLREEMNRIDVDYYAVSALDEIAWLLNMRGKDVQYNPVAIAYVLVSKTTAHLFIHPDKVSEELKDNTSIQCEDISSILHFISGLGEHTKVAVDKNKLNYLLYEQIEKHAQAVSTTTWVDLQKAQKNTTEIEGFRKAMILDGIALVRFFMWLEKSVEEEHPLTEYSIGIKLREFRSASPVFIDESFASIVGYNGNGAIVHYSAPSEGSAPVKNEGILLIDSGGQYVMGTTDITRTVALGPFPEKARKDFTLVLKGHLALTRITFPENTRGSQIDVLARQFLWDNNLDYGHGTGHGVGHFLNVHEGPQSIRKEPNPVTLYAGMVMSNEPGLYRTGEYGLRAENVVAIRKKEENEFGSFLEFVTLTLYPYDRSLIDISLLTKQELNQINDYHKMVYDQLSPYLTADEKLWLQHKTRPIPHE